MIAKLAQKLAATLEGNRQIQHAFCNMLMHDFSRFVRACASDKSIALAVL